MSVGTFLFVNCKVNVYKDMSWEVITYLNPQKNDIFHIIIFFSRVYRIT